MQHNKAISEIVEKYRYLIYAAFIAIIFMIVAVLIYPQFAGKKTSTPRFHWDF